MFGNVCKFSFIAMKNHLSTLLLHLKVLHSPFDRGNMFIGEMTCLSTSKVSFSTKPKNLLDKAFVKNFIQAAIHDSLVFSLLHQNVVTIFDCHETFVDQDLKNKLEKYFFLLSPN